MQIISYPTVPYDQAYTLQKQLVRRRQIDAIQDTVLMLEHPPTYTMGADRKWDHLLYSPAVLEEQGFKIFSCDRGGDITYHGPGQLVVYPIIHLRQAGLTPIAFVRCLEQVVINLLQHYGLEGSRKKGLPGVWLDDAKICALGIGISQRVTYHGLALNVHPNLRHFANIVPCGLTQFGVTSISREMDGEVQLSEVKSKFISAWEEVFQVPCEVVKKTMMTGGTEIGKNAGQTTYAVQR